jgi:hypothetical protein
METQRVGSVRNFVWRKSLVNFRSSSQVRGKALGE